MQLEALRDIVVAALEEVKAQDIKILDVREIASFTDLMVIASGSSSRQVKALADKVIENARWLAYDPGCRRPAGGGVGAGGFERHRAARHVAADPRFLQSGEVMVGGCRQGVGALSNRFWRDAHEDPSARRGNPHAELGQGRL